MVKWQLVVDMNLFLDKIVEWNTSDKLNWNYWAYVSWLKGEWSVVCSVGGTDILQVLIGENFSKAILQGCYGCMSWYSCNKNGTINFPPENMCSFRKLRICNLWRISGNNGINVWWYMQLFGMEVKDSLCEIFFKAEHGWTKSEGKKHYTFGLRWCLPLSPLVADRIHFLFYGIIFWSKLFSCDMIVIGWLIIDRLLIAIRIALSFDQNNDLNEENNFDQNIMPYFS